MKKIFFYLLLFFISCSETPVDMDEKLFAKNNVNIEYQNYSSIVYEQHQTTKFIPDLSIIDLLFNLGRDSLKAITKES